jgi:small-conductance mechanosensitive channel
VNPKLGQPWIPIERIEAFIQLEPVLLIFGLAAGSLVVYKLLLRAVSQERHRNLRKLFGNLAAHLGIWVALLLVYLFFHNVADDWLPLSKDASTRLSSYVGLLTLFSGATVFVKTWRILVWEYLFLGHMKVGVPLLLVNIFTLLLSITLGGWIITEIFNVRLAPLLATSAIFSIILGLALQDTLGNLFAGVALTFDKPYEIGDWIEVQTGPQKWIGQVNEISWRATVLIGLSDESLTIPNRVMAQAQISNFSVKTRPFIRSQMFRVAYGSDLEKVRKCLLESVTGVAAVRSHPAPLVLIIETHESWIPCKLVYFIDDYGSQFSVADRVITSALESLDKAGIRLAPPRLSITHDGANASV